MRTFETVPNVSTAHPAHVLAVVRALAAPGVRVIHASSDASHGRTVLTALGAAEVLCDGLVRVARHLKASLDLRDHAGVHPRVGLLDVAPLIALAPEGPAEDAAVPANDLLARLASEAGVPCVGYDAADPSRRSLPDLRRGGLERLLARVESGEVQAHRPAPADEDVRRTGFTCVGARGVLVAFNVELVTDDVARARAWARALRETEGGLPAVRAMGFRLRAGACQVAMNLLDHRLTSPLQAFLAVEELARAAGVEVARSELIGCAPRAGWPEGLGGRVRDPQMGPPVEALRILETWLPGGALADHPGLDAHAGRLRLDLP